MCVHLFNQVADLLKILNNHLRKGTAPHTGSALDSIDRRGDSRTVLRVLLLSLEVPFYRRAPLIQLNSR